MNIIDALVKINTNLRPLQFWMETGWESLRTHFPRLKDYDSGVQKTFQIFQAHNFDTSDLLQEEMYSFRSDSPGKPLAIPQVVSKKPPVEGWIVPMTPAQRDYALEVSQKYIRNLGSFFRVLQNLRDGLAYVYRAGVSDDPEWTKLSLEIRQRFAALFEEHQFLNSLFHLLNDFHGEMYLAKSLPDDLRENPYWDFWLSLKLGGRASSESGIPLLSGLRICGLPED